MGGTCKMQALYLTFKKQNYKLWRILPEEVYSEYTPVYKNANGDYSLFVSQHTAAPWSAIPPLPGPARSCEKVGWAERDFFNAVRIFSQRRRIQSGLGTHCCWRMVRLKYKTKIILHSAGAALQRMAVVYFQHFFAKKLEKCKKSNKFAAQSCKKRVCWVCTKILVECFIPKKQLFGE